MACTFVRVPSAAGGRISAIWDGIIIGNAKWSCFDASAGANAKVYRCYDAVKSVDFYVYVDDNQANYSIIELWEGWNAGTHVGVGDSITNVSLNYFWLYAVGGTYVIFNDHRVIIASGYKDMQYYIGQLKRIDETKNMPVYIGFTDGTIYYNPLGFYESATSVAWRALFNHTGANNKLLSPWGYYGSELFAKTILGTYFFQETPVLDDGTKLILGLLDGVCRLYNTDNGFFGGEIISCEDGDWLVQGGAASSKYWSAVRLV